MPLRDHFHLPTLGIASWQEVHGGWPMVIVQQLFGILPKGYVAAPRVQLGEVEDEYEVRVYDATQARQLVAAIELVSPRNKDRPESRHAFVTKCAALLQDDVSVSIVDLVTSRNFNLYSDLLEEFGRSDPEFTATRPSIYAVTCRNRKLRGSPKFAVWAHALAVGKELPRLPIWLTEELSVLVDLEESYEETCRVLHIP